ncbi:MAG: hypothetical protein HC934_05155 [Acaryochloridaceae cyanobacterium SU_2_1]|nr:hypothetical protein [Acaryochloridaceae cyanobacterium SU_2_1]
MRQTAPQTRDSSRDRFAAGKPLWARAIATPALEFAPTALPVLQGQIPEALRGTLYRNGPGRLQRQQQRVAHWFDGDGGILAVHFAADGATAQYRYVQTPAWQAEAAADRFLYSGYGQLAPGPLWRRWTAQPKNAANTSVLALPDKILALWEGGHPYALDPVSLATKGLDDLSGLSPQQPYSAHPKRDPQTGNIYNFGMIFGKEVHLQLYRSSPSGQIEQQATIPLPRASLVHDFVLAGPYLVFVVPPLSLQVLPLLLGFKSLSDALRWQPELGSQIILVDRDSLEVVSRFETDPWFQWHFANGYLDETGAIVLDYVRYPDFKTNQWLQEVVSGQPHTPAKGTLWQLRLDPQTSQILAHEQRLPLSCEFPVVSPLELGQAPQALYLIHQAQPEAPIAEMFNCISRVEQASGKLTTAQFATGCYPMEAIYAPRPDQPGQGWLLTVVFDGHQDQSTVQIFAAEQLDAGPLCVLALPEVIPLGFHGTWQAAIDSDRS